MTLPGGKATILALASAGAAALGALWYRRAHQKYPYTYRDGSFEFYKSEARGRVMVPTPYKWLEDPDSSMTQAWVDAQNRVTDQFMRECPDIQPIYEKVLALNNYEKFGVPFRQGHRVFYFHNSGLQDHYVLYKQDSLDGKESVLLDPNTFSADSTVSLGGYSISESGRFIAYSTSASGSDWNTIKIRCIDDGVDLEEKLEWVKFSSISWDHQDRGFFYCRYPTPKSLDGETKEEKRGQETDRSEFHNIYYHSIGTPQSQDILVYTDPEHGEYLHGAEVTDDGRYVLITVSCGCEPVNKLYYFDLVQYQWGTNSERPPQLVKLIDNFDASYSYITNTGSVFYFRTNLNSARKRIIAIDFENPDPSNWREILPEHKQDVLKYAVCVNQDYLLVCYMRDVKDVLMLYRLDGEFVKQLELPGPGQISSLSARKQDPDFFYSFTSFLYAGITMRYDVNTDQSVVFRQTKVGDLDPDMFVSKQVFYPSKDGTLIPMYLIHRKDLVLNGSNPTWLYGYGGFNISFLPSFSASRLLFAQHYNGVYALANLRGGGEYGEEWHKAGQLFNKQNVFDDFHAAAEYLIKHQYTCAKKLAIQGGSNGGLLVGACINQRPELYGCAIAQVGVMDMLTYHRFTIGHAWKTEYGDPEDPKHFDNIYKYSPVHNVRDDVEYPSVLLLAADHDDRVVPSHSYKYIATVQHVMGHRVTQRNPLLIRVHTKAGHGAGKPLKKVIEETAEIMGFVVKTLKAQYRD
eukprot:TRINITY_DN3335_c0_g4_i1.p1 TRINITY_DN3335_c0_g4~~TRINITY_DN3335_c0_g4_i1.p1  ORF type:complete len:745 (+),score=189.14 TRINITY_DN3335_c0_g4_i1:73-2307(+)